jgi:hypothetical protein
MRGNLDKIFRCVRVWSAKQSHERLVDPGTFGARSLLRAACGLLRGARSLPRIEHVGQTRMGVLEGLMRPHEL